MADRSRCSHSATCSASLSPGKACRSDSLVLDVQAERDKAEEVAAEVDGDDTGAGEDERAPERVLGHDVGGRSRRGELQSCSEGPGCGRCG